MIHPFYATLLFSSLAFQKTFCSDHGPFEHLAFQRGERMQSLPPCGNHGNCGLSNNTCTNGMCQCPEFHIMDGNKCIPGALLGSPCTSDAQCSARVPQSHCLEGICQCNEGLVRHKKHLCLKPADVGQNCYSNDQCTFKNPLSYCKFIVPKVHGRCQCQPPFIMTTLGCMERSKSTEHNEDKQARVLHKLKPVSLGYPCSSDVECQMADRDSSCRDGVCDCTIIGPGLCQAKRTGCYSDTFQCRSNGRCISRLLMCNGRPDCDDGSDEECNGPVCPPTTITCWNNEKSGFRCISGSARCDGKKQCEDGSDELGCASGNATTCPSQTYRCRDGTCVPGYAFCNAVISCPDASDEDGTACREEFEPVRYCPFRCDNGRCRSTSVLCSGSDGCGDNSDEKKCQICKCTKRERHRSSAEVIASSTSWHIIQKRPNWSNRLFL